MIPRLSQSDTLRGYSPVSAPRADASQPRDGFVRSSGEAQAIYSPRPEWRSEARPARGIWKTAMWTAMLGVSATSALAAMPAQSLAADLQQAVAPKSKETLKAEGLKLLLSSRAVAGQQASVAETLASLNPRAASLVSTLPAEAQQAYADLEPPAKAWLNERIQGTTTAALGLVRIDNREAFISGSAVGQDVFAIARRGLAKQVKHGVIPVEMQTRLNGIVDLLARMSPEQRANLVEALEADLTSR